MVQLSPSYMTTGKTIALTRWTFVGRVTSLLFNMLSRLAIGWFSYRSFWKSQPASSVQFGECKCVLIWALEVFVTAPELKGFFLILFFVLFYNQFLLLTVHKSFFLLQTMLLVIQISIKLKKLLEYSWLTVLLVSGEQQSDSVTHTHLFILF